MLKNYLNQTARLERKSGVDQWGNPKYSPFVDIRCRIQKTLIYAQLVQDEKAAMRTVLYTDAEVSAGDKINGEIVTATDDWVMIDGNIIGFKVVV